MESNAEAVKTFTQESGFSCPDKPQALDKASVQFMLNMCVSELVELAQTVADSPEEAVNMVLAGVNVDLNTNYKKPETEVEIIAEQADAVVDCWYYALNTLAKHGINASKVFNVVHSANMNKKFPDNKFHKREDGKILKPEDWSPPDIIQEIKNQIKNGF